MSVSVGNRVVVCAHSLIVPQGESAEIPFNHDGTSATVVISFSEDASGKSDIQFSLAENKMRLNFINWANVVGTSTQEPVYIANIEDKHALSIMAANWRVGNANSLSIQLMVG